MAGMKLLDREIVDSDETHAERHEVLGSVGREIRVVAAEIALADEARVSRPQKHTFMSGEWLGVQVGFGDGHEVGVERHDEWGPYEGMEVRRLDDGSAG